MVNSDVHQQQPDVVEGRGGLTDAMVHAASSSRPRERAAPANSGSSNPAFEEDVSTEDQSAAARPTTEPLPDVLPLHVLPPYVQARHNQQRDAGRHRQRRQRRTRSRQQRQREGTTQVEDPEAAGCCSRLRCLHCITTVTSFRWVLVALAMLGVCCVVTGIILGALHMTVGDSFLTLSLMFIGLGVMLVVVVGLGWKCTPLGHEPCHLLFNLGNHAPGANSPRRTLRSHHRHRHHWHGGALHPEFGHRRPPPSYNSSQNDFERHQRAAADGNEHDNADNYSLPNSSPPTYRSRASTVRTGLEITFPPQSDSRPPTYRSRASEVDRPSLSLEEEEEEEEEVPAVVVDPVEINIEAPCSASDAPSPRTPEESPSNNQSTDNVTAIKSVKNAVRMFDNMGDADSRPSTSSGSGQRSRNAKSGQKGT